MPGPGPAEQRIPRRRRRVLLVGSGAATSLAVLLLAAGGDTSAVLTLLPAILMASALALRCYPGERLVRTIAARRRASARRAAVAPTGVRLAPRRSPRHAPHGGRLVALALGGHGPPSPVPAR